MQKRSSKGRACLILLTIIILVQACSAPAPVQVNNLSIATESIPTATAAVTATTTPEVTPTMTPSPAPPAAPTAPAPIPVVIHASETDPYTGLTIDGLTTRSFGGGGFQVDELLEETDDFRRYLISYISDGLMVYGFMNVPNGDGPFPVILAVHGYIEPERYQTIDYTTHYADTMARAGYLVIHPNMRGYPPSEDGPNLFRIGFAIDILNLIALVKNQGGQDGPLQPADPARIGLWGHSMGGGVSLRVLTVSPDVKAAVLYGAMSGDEHQNYDRIYSVLSNNTRGKEELQTPPEMFARLSPANYLDRINAAVSIHHGDADATVPPQWSADLCSRLQTLDKPIECFTYPGQPHTFTGKSDQEFMQRVLDFYERTLR